MDWGIWSRVRDAIFRIQGLEFRVLESGFRFRVQGLEFRVEGSGFGV